MARTTRALQKAKESRNLALIALCPTSASHVPGSRLVSVKTLIASGLMSSSRIRSRNRDYKPYASFAHGMLPQDRHLWQRHLAGFGHRVIAYTATIVSSRICRKTVALRLHPKVAKARLLVKAKRESRDQPAPKARAKGNLDLRIIVPPPLIL